MNSSLMDKDIIRAVVGDDETKPLLDVKPLNGSRVDAVRETPDAEGSVYIGSKAVGSRESANRDASGGLENGSKHDAFAV